MNTNVNSAGLRYEVLGNVTEPTQLELQGTPGIGDPGTEKTAFRPLTDGYRVIPHSPNLVRRAEHLGSLREYGNGVERTGDSAR